MKKTLLTLATVVATAFVAVACPTGTNVVECTADNETDVCGEDQICAIDGDATTGDCVDPDCGADSDCDLQDTSESSPIFTLDELDAGNDECEDEEYVTFVGFDGTKYCGQEDTAETPCADGETAVQTERASGGNVDVCVIADGTCDIALGTCS